MTETQMFGYTPPNPDTGLVGYVAMHLQDDGTGVVTVRAHGSADGDTAACPIAAADLMRLADAATGAALACGQCDEPMLQFFAFGYSDLSVEP